MIASESLHCVALEMLKHVQLYISKMFLVSTKRQVKQLYFLDKYWYFYVCSWCFCMDDVDASVLIVKERRWQAEAEGLQKYFEKVGRQK